MNGLPRMAGLVVCAAAAALALPPRGLAPGREAPPLEDLIVVQIPASAGPRSPDGAGRFTPLGRYVAGARIMRVSPSRGTPVVLTPEFTAACDPDVSVDGETIVFAGRRGPRDSWQIWKMKADGSGKTQVTRRPGQSVAPGEFPE